MDRSFYIQKRNEFFNKLPNKSIAIIHSGITQYTSLDGEYPFEVDRNFFYFTGIAVPDMKLLLTKAENTSIALIRQKKNGSENFSLRMTAVLRAESKILFSSMNWTTLFTRSSMQIEWINVFFIRITLSSADLRQSTT